MKKSLLWGILILGVLSFGFNATATEMTPQEKFLIEVNYVASCQFLDPNNDADGTINSVRGLPTWGEPGIISQGILLFIMAWKTFNDESYISKANRAADFLVRVQRPDGGWCNQYTYAEPGDLNNPSNREAWAESPRHAAQAVYALYKLYELGFRDEKRYNAIKKGAGFLMGCQEPENKAGRDDGLVCGGKDADGIFRSPRWGHDNAYSFWALTAAEYAALCNGEKNSSELCAVRAARVLKGINETMYDPNTGVWHIVVDHQGVPLKNPHLPCLGDDAQFYPSWMQYAPQMLDLPARGVNSPKVAEWILDNLKEDEGYFEWCCEDGELKQRFYPGSALQAALVFFDIPEYSPYGDRAIKWVEESGLWVKMRARDKMVDWHEIFPDPNRIAPDWHAYPDTSLLAGACWMGGYNFALSPPLIEEEKNKEGEEKGCFIAFLRPWIFR